MISRIFMSKFLFLIFFREVVSLGEEAHLNTSFKHFIYFVQVNFEIIFIEKKTKKQKNYISSNSISGISTDWEKRIGPTARINWSIDRQFRTNDQDVANDRTLNIFLTSSSAAFFGAKIQTFYFFGEEFRG